jgi:UDP-glucose-4-epimerase GalE
MPGSFFDNAKHGTWVVTGGAGYLGRALFLRLRSLGVSVFAIDNFSTSHRITDPGVLEADLTKAIEMAAVQKQIPGPVAGIFHFAAHALVGESQEKPELYYRNNLMAAHAVAKWSAGLADKPVIIHSSSCAVYGTPTKLPLTEASPLAPISPYGLSKKLAEEILNDAAKSHQLRILNLRYFNPVGALEDGSHGEDHEPETHLVPNVIQSTLSAKPVQIFGTDYDTRDGTCLRDFFHLEDLVDAHLMAAQYLLKQTPGHHDCVNLGSGRSVSVREVIALVEKTLGKKAIIEEKPRRAGDPPELMASIELAQRKLGWSPKRTLEQAIATHLLWLKKD